MARDMQTGPICVDERETDDTEPIDCENGNEENTAAEYVHSHGIRKGMGTNAPLATVPVQLIDIRGGRSMGIVAKRYFCTDDQHQIQKQ